MVRRWVRRLAHRLWRKLRPDPVPPTRRAPPPEPEIIEVTGDEFVAWRAKSDLVLVDVREPHEWLAGHAEGALLIAMADIVSESPRIPPGRVVVYCAAGSRSYGVARWMRDNGRADVWSLEGGFGEYVGRGGPWVRPPPRPAFPLRSRVIVGERPGVVHAARETPDGIRYGVRFDDDARGLLVDRPEEDLKSSDRVTRPDAGGSP